jgi:UDP-glucose 4-epimerase
VTVVVLGGAGFIGRHFCRSLVAADRYPIIVDPRELLAEPGVPMIHHRTPAEVFADGNEWLTYRSSTDVVVNLASPVGPVGILTAWPVASRIMSASMAAVSLAQQYGARLVNISTSEVYGQGGVYLESTEIHVPARHSARLGYAVGKLAAEMDVHTSRVDAVTLRPFNVAGPGQSADQGFVIPRMVRQATVGLPITVYEPGTQRRAFMHVADMVAAIFAAIGYDPPVGGARVFNVGNAANEVAMLRLAQMVTTMSGSSAEPIIVDPRAEHGLRFEEAAGMTKLPDCALAERLLGWRPELDLREIVADVIAEHREARSVG